MTASRAASASARGPSYAFARRQGVLVSGWDDEGRAAVAMREPGNPEALAELRRVLGVPLRVERIAAQDFDALLQSVYAGGDSGAGRIAADLGDELDLERIAEALPEPRDLLESDDDAPIIRLINAMLTQAIKENASDIHIEPDENRLTVRFRVDGVMREVMQPPRELGPLIVSRIKVMSDLDIAEKRLPQDGRIALRVAGRAVDVRVSTLPSGFGERAVLRLLDKQSGRLDLGELGMDERTLERARALLAQPHGIVLVTGPTGSGKTTTLYAMLAELNDRSRNIMTVEDPIEYQLEGIAQTQVNPRVELTFARGLRAILRQDPDIVMVGEIRDLETARIAVQASLTGHLVFSTLHTNTAVGAITRLQDMGIEPFLLSASLSGVLAQRLVRRLDPETAEPWQAQPEDLRALGYTDEGHATLYRPRRDLPDGHSGYAGRTGIYELVPIDDRLRELIHEAAGEAALREAARRIAPALVRDGLDKALAGVTSLEEVLRVAR